MIFISPSPPLLPCILLTSQLEITNQISCGSQTKSVFSCGWQTVACSLSENDCYCIRKRKLKCLPEVWAGKWNNLQYSSQALFLDNTYFTQTLSCISNTQWSYFLVTGLLRPQPTMSKVQRRLVLSDHHQHPVLKVEFRGTVQLQHWAPAYSFFIHKQT